jgi:hypothetical protein
MLHGFLLQKGCWLFSLSTQSAQAYGGVLDRAGFHRSGVLRTVLDASTARDAFDLVNHVTALCIDGTSRTAIGASSAMGASVSDRDEVDIPKLGISSKVGQLQ